MASRSIFFVILMLLTAGAEAGDKFIAATGRVRGLADTFFRTDLRVVNLSAEEAEFELALLPTGGGTAPVPATFTIAPRESMAIDDVLGSLFGFDQATAAVRIRSEAAFSAASRTWTPSESCAGTFGQFIPAVDLSHAVTRGIIPFVQLSASLSSGSRTNVGAVNPTSAPVDVTLTLRTVNGNAAGTATLQVPAQAHVQASVATLFSTGTFGTTNAFIEVTSAIPVLAYGSVIDNVSGDSIFIPAEPDSGSPREQIVMTARQWAFEPSTLTVKRGKPVTLLVRSLDVNHGINFSGVGPQNCSSQDLGPCILRPGETVSVSFTPPDTGTFAWFCTVFCHHSEDGTEGHATMRGTLVVTE